MQTLENDIFTQKVHPSGLVELSFKDGQLFDVQHMILSKKFSLKHMGEQKICLLVSFQGAFYTTREARELLANPEYSSHQKAIAVITRDLSIRLLASLYLRINKPKVPLKLFNDEADARRWLLGWLTLPLP